MRFAPRSWSQVKAYAQIGFVSSLVLAWLGSGLAESAHGQGAADATTGSSPFRFAPVDETGLGLWDGDAPVLVYRHGVVSKEGVPASFNRSTYFHPIYDLDGNVLTEDFPEDHYHHRGLFWAWPHVQIEGQEYDLWVLRGIRFQFEKWLAQKSLPDQAVLGVRNGWYVGDRKVMDERIWARIHKANEGTRAIDVHGTWAPTDAPVTLLGAEGKSYGGLTFRFAPGADTRITIAAGKTSEDLYMTRQPWTDLTRVWPGQTEPSGAAVFVHPSHPDFPPTWLTRHYGVLCMGWPGVVSRTITPEQPFEGRYRVLIHRRALDAAAIQAHYDAYKAETSPPHAGAESAPK